MYSLSVPDTMATETQSRPLFIRLTLPDGLEEALEGLAREVLRSQPDNILEFAANHFEQLVKTRVSTGSKYNYVNNYYLSRILT